MTAGRDIRLYGAAREWLEALPLGNGRLGAMCWGGVPTRIDLNEESVWSGHPGSERAQRRVSEDEAACLVTSARAAVLDGRPGDAADPLKAAQGGHAQAFLPVGGIEIDLDVSVGGADTRRLSLAEAIHTSDAAAISAETFVSAPADVLVHRVTGLSGDAAPTVTFDSPLAEASHDDAEGTMLRVLRAPVDVAPGHEPHLPAAVWPAGGEESVTAAVCIRTRRTGDELIVIVAIETTYPGLGESAFTPVEHAIRRAREKSRAAIATPYAALRHAHVAAHAELFDRVHLTTDVDAPTEDTAHRLERARAAESTALADPDLVPLLFDYGRYLLIACSREPGRLPATLQGIWNAEMRPPWSSAYTLNINTEMNYWAAETTNLPETVEPLIGLIAAIARSGEATARDLGAAGWAAHHNSDAWGHSAGVGEGSGDPSWAFWPMAGLWLTRHIVERAAFGSRDADATEDPLVRGAAEFALSWLVDLPGDVLGTAPSTSPENTYVGPHGRATALGTTSTMDLALTRDVLAHVAQAQDELGARARAALDRLPRLGDRAATDGVLEWDRPVTEIDERHRHLSHLYPLFPGDAADDAFERAAAISLERRGADSTGWSLAWKTALWARLGRPDRIDELIELFLRDAGGQGGQWAGGLYPNLFAAHPPFQIDGNLGFTGAIAEAFVQSHRGEIELLRAVPSSMPSGSVRGLVARPGVVVDIAWTDHQLTSATLRARDGRDGSVRVRWRGRTTDVAVHSAHPTTITPASAFDGPQTPAGEK